GRPSPVRKKVEAIQGLPGAALRGVAELPPAPRQGHLRPCGAATPRGDSLEELDTGPGRPTNRELEHWPAEFSVQPAQVLRHNRPRRAKSVGSKALWLSGLIRPHIATR